MDIFFTSFGQNSSIISFCVSGDNCRLPITFANSLDPDQDQQNVGPDSTLGKNYYYVKKKRQETPTKV